MGRRLAGSVSREDSLLIPLGLRNKFRKMLGPLGKGLASTGISPSTITILGIIPALAAGYAFAQGRVRPGGVLIGISGLFDLADGLVARTANKQSKAGALLDSTIDRYSEVAIFLGLAVLFKQTATLYAVMLALGGSLMVSYVKARAEGLGSRCESGMLQRPERLVILLVGALLGMTPLRWAIWIIAVAANATAVERLISVRKLMGGPGG